MKRNIRKLKRFNDDAKAPVPRTKGLIAIDAMPNGACRAFATSSEAESFAMRVYYLRRKFRRNIVPVVRQLNQIYKVWVLRY